MPSPKFQIPFLGLNTANKAEIVNTAIIRLEMAAQPSVIDKDLTAPPGAPSEGDTYIVGAAATGAWSGQDDALTVWYDGAWRFVTPFPGLCAYVIDEDTFYCFRSGAWSVDPRVNP